MTSHLQIPYTPFGHYSELSPDDQALVLAAVNATRLSYAPYSGFRVGAAVSTTGGRILEGANQENASFSLTICAERTVLGIYASLDTDETITAMAIAYTADQVDPKALLSPCGACRQHILEYQNRQEAPFRILMTAPDGSGIEVASIRELLPFAFTGAELPKP